MRELVLQEIRKISPVSNIYAARYLVDLIALYFNEWDFVKPSMVSDFLSRKNVDLSPFLSLTEIMKMISNNKKLGVFELERAILFG